MTAPALSSIDLNLLATHAPPVESLDLSTAPITAPALGAVDLSALETNAPPVESLDLSNLSPAPPSGISAQGDLSFLLHPEGIGVQTFLGDGATGIRFAVASTGSLTKVNRGIGDATISFKPRGEGFQDWLSLVRPHQVQELYRLIVTGSGDSVDDLVIGGISSWQATNQSRSRSSYVQAVIPAASAILPKLDERRNGELIIQKGYKFEDKSTRYEEIARSGFDTVRPDRGRYSLTVTVSGYMPNKVESSGTRSVAGIRSISSTNGKRRVRCDIDLFLRPGMQVSALGETFIADYINYYVNKNDKFCEIGER